MSAVADAAYNTVHDYPGGAEALAPRMGKSAKVLDSKVSRNVSTHHLTLHEAVQIMGLTGDHRMLRAICRHLGYLDPIRAVVYEGIADEQLLELVAAVHSETGDVSRSLVAALADGRVTQREFESFDEQTVSVAENSKIEWTDRVCELEDELAAVRAEIEAMTALAELRDRLRGMVVEDPVRLRKV